MRGGRRRGREAWQDAGRGRSQRDAIIRFMGKSSKENEIKLAFPSTALAREALTNAGARLSNARRFEDNVVFDRDDRALQRSGRVLRLRRDGDRVVLTL